MGGVTGASRGYEFSLKKDSSEAQDEISDFFLEQVCTIMTLELQKNLLQTVRYTQLGPLNVLEIVWILWEYLYISAAWPRDGHTLPAPRVSQGTPRRLNTHSPPVLFHS